MQIICFLLGVLATQMCLVCENSPSCILTVGTPLYICDASIKNKIQNKNKIPREQAQDLSIKIPTPTSLLSQTPRDQGNLIGNSEDVNMHAYTQEANSLGIKSLTA